MALKISGAIKPATPVAPPPPPVLKPKVEVARTKYGQVACGICKREPPLGETPICYTCGKKGQ